MVQESLEDAVLAKDSSQPQSSYKVAATLIEFELKKILIDKMDKSESYLAAPEHRECYEGLIKSYDLDKTIFSTYGKVYSLKRSRKDKDKDERRASLDQTELKKMKTTRMRRPIKGPKAKGITVFELMKMAQVQIKIFWKVSEWKIFNSELKVTRKRSTPFPPATNYQYRHRKEPVHSIPIPGGELRGNLKGFIYVNNNRRNRLMRSDKLYKFSDRTLTGLRTSLDDITKNIQMKYLPKRRWSMLEKKRANIMIKAIDKQLKERRLMRNLKKFVGRRHYGNDLRLLQRTI
ncbi:hypothetical protein Tco_0781228 [Tanacetum coccineum]